MYACQTSESVHAGNSQRVTLRISGIRESRLLVVWQNPANIQDIRQVVTTEHADYILDCSSIDASGLQILSNGWEVSVWLHQNCFDDLPWSAHIAA